MTDLTINVPSFYAIIPASVRYDSDLPANAKLLYGEITALCNAYGYCFASNEYFAALYGVDDRTVRRWLNQLEDKNYIIRGYEKDELSGRKRRVIRLIDSILREAASEGGTKMSGKGGQKCPVTPDKNVRHNNTYNNTFNISRVRARDKNKFNNYEQRNYDMTALERALLAKQYDQDGDSS